MLLHEWNYARLITGAYFGLGKKIYFVKAKINAIASDFVSKYITDGIYYSMNMLINTKDCVFGENSPSNNWEREGRLISQLMLINL